MISDIARIDLRIRRRMAYGSTFGMVVYTFVVVALYPSFKNETSLDKLTENGSAVAALFGASGSLTSPTGWLSANIYANVLPLIALMVGIGYGATCLAGQAEDGQLALLVTLPRTRRQIVADKTAVLASQTALVVIGTAGAALLGRAFDLRVSVGALISTSFAIWLMSVAFGLLAMLIGAATGSRGLALGIASGAAGLSYLVGSLAPVISWLKPLRYTSAFFYTVDDNQLSHGAAPASLVLLTFAVGALFVATRKAFATMDLK